MILAIVLYVLTYVGSVSETVYRGLSGCLRHGTDPFPYQRRRTVLPKLLKTRLFTLHSSTITVSENEIGIRPFTAYSEVHLTGLRSIPCFRSLNIVSASFLERQRSEISDAVNRRLGSRIILRGRPGHIIVRLRYVCMRSVPET